MEVLVAPTMAKLLQLGTIPDDNKRTLDEYLSKLEGMIDRIKDYQAKCAGQAFQEQELHGSLAGGLG
jgi:hypothetical protein